MREISLPEPEPEPSPYPINIVTGQAYEDDGLASYYRQLEAEQLERAAVAHLVVLANKLLLEDPRSTGHWTDRVLETDNAKLRRTVADGSGVTAYFFTIHDREVEYHSSWTHGADHVHRYNESAEKIAERLGSVFSNNDVHIRSNQRSRIGKIRRKVLDLIR